MDEFTLGGIDSLAYQVERGVKPAAEVTVKADKALECVSFVHKHHPKVTCYVEECATAPGWSFVWMMKDARMLDVIIQRPLEPKTAADHFYLGALFGYSGTAILDFVEKWSKRDCDLTMEEAEHKLWKFFKDEHALILTAGELDDIVHAVDVFNDAVNHPQRGINRNKNEKQKNRLGIYKICKWRKEAPPRAS